MGFDNLRWCPVCKQPMTPDVGPQDCYGSPGAPHARAATVASTDWNDKRLPVYEEILKLQREGKVTDKAAAAASAHISDIAEPPHATVKATAEKGVKLEGGEASKAQEWGADGKPTLAAVATP